MLAKLWENRDMPGAFLRHAFRRATEIQMEARLEKLANLLRQIHQQDELAAADPEFAAARAVDFAMGPLEGLDLVEENALKTLGKWIEKDPTAVRSVFEDVIKNPAWKTDKDKFKLVERALRTDCFIRLFDDAPSEASDFVLENPFLSLPEDSQRLILGTWAGAVFLERSQKIRETALDFLKSDSDPDLLNNRRKVRAFAEANMAADVVGVIEAMPEQDQRSVLDCPMARVALKRITRANKDGDPDLVARVNHLEDSLGLARTDYATGLATTVRLQSLAIQRDALSHS